MAFVSAEPRAGGKDSHDPMQIAHHALFTAKEKLDLLHRIKAEMSGSMSADFGFSLADVDEAINEVRLDALQGEQTKTVIWGEH